MRVRTEAKRQAILDEASKTFFELGFERTSMAEISARVGGSKATLYGYFPSKEQLFTEVARSCGEMQIGHAFDTLMLCADGDEAGALQRFGEAFLGYVSLPEAVSIQRMVIAESGHTAIGQLFFDAGPKIGNDAVAEFLKGAMARGRLRRADLGVATSHLMALLNAEIMPRHLLGLPVNTSRGQIKKIVERAVAAFTAAYAP